MKLLTSISICLLFSINTFSQDNTDISRKKILLCFASGVANSNIQFPDKKDTYTNLALNWKIGYMLNPRFALLLNGAVSVYEYDLSDRKRLRDFGGLYASAQYFVSDRFWILGGLGLGTDAPVFYDLKPKNEIEINYYTGVGAISSIGYEILRTKNFVLDLQARVNYNSVNLPIGTTHGLSTAFLIGINLY
jgi:hypothetical protein